MGFHLALVLALLAAGCAGGREARPTGTTEQVMRRVADWQLAHPMHPDTDWKNGVFYAGVVATYHATGDRRYRDALIAMGERNGWRLGPEPRLADDHCIGQTYLDVYFATGESKTVADVRRTFDAIAADPRPGRVEWFWCDSLFMAPAVMSRLSAAVGDPRYLDLMDAMWWDTTDFLYDRSERLFFRDKNFFEARERNGAKVFWCRGNGWVMAGLVRVLQHMPPGYPTRERYLRLYRDMAARVAALQQADGFWRSSLLDPAAYPGGESSGTALFTYALAWGVNRREIPGDVYGPVIAKGWHALVGAVDADGRLGWVQKPDERPNLLQATDTETYGVGAFLLAGSEVLKLRSADGITSIWGPAPPAGRRRRG